MQRTKARQRFIMVRRVAPVGCIEWEVDDTISDMDSKRLWTIMGVGWFLAMCCVGCAMVAGKPIETPEPVKPAVDARQVQTPGGAKVARPGEGL
jgi:hypothetical protein